MSATPDTTALAARARRRTGDRERRTERIPVDIRWRPIERRARIEEAVADVVRIGAPRRGRRRARVPARHRRDPARRSRRCAGTLPSDVDVRAARRRAVARRAGPRPRAVAARAAPRRAVDRHRRDVAHRRRRARRRRLRPRAGTALRHPDRHDPADDGHHEPGVGRPARRTGRPRRARACATGCGARSSTARGRPTGQPEIEEVDLAGLALELAAWGTAADEPGVHDRRRRPRRCGPAGELLAELGALDADGRITAHRVAGCSACRCTPGWRRCWSPSRARSAARWRRCSTSATSCAAPATSCRATSRSVSGCSPVAAATIRPTGAPSSVSATGPPTWPAGSASRFDAGHDRRRSRRCRAAARLSRPARRPPPPGPVPAPIRHRRLAAGQRSAGPRGVRRRRRSRRPARPVADPARRRARRRRGRARARRPGRRVAFGSSGTRIATTSSNASNAGSGRCGSASRCAPPGPDPPPSMRCSPASAPPAWRCSAGRPTSLVAAPACQLPAPHARRTVARLEHRAR